jgi:hypothetical protein
VKETRTGSCWCHAAASQQRQAGPGPRSDQTRAHNLDLLLSSMGFLWNEHLRRAGGFDGDDGDGDCNETVLALACVASMEQSRTSRVSDQQLLVLASKALLV